eukprot:COSAG06_NODE_4_length_41837_cov_204.557597_19_plen_87_part_00
MSFKQGDHTRDYEWMLELEEVVEQGLDPPNIAHVKQLMMMAKICDVAQVRRKRSVLKKKHFESKNDRVAKIGSGQTEGNTSKKTLF